MNLQDAIKLRVAKLGFLDDIRNLRSRLDIIEKWRIDLADPKMLENKEFINIIDTFIKNKITPTINKAVNDIKKAGDNVQATLDEAKAVFNQVKKTGDNLKTDGVVVKNQIDNLKSVLDSEVGKISQAFNLFGLELKTSAVDIVDKTKAIALEMKEAKQEIEPALNAAAYEARQIVPRMQALNPIGSAFAIFRCLSLLLFAKPANAPAQAGPVIPELLEAIQQISGAFDKLGISFNNFGTVMKDAPEELGGTINNASKAVKTSVGNFTGSFVSLIGNLSDNLKGLVPKAIFLPETVILAPTPRTEARIYPQPPPGVLPTPPAGAVLLPPPTVMPAGVLPAGPTPAQIAAAQAAYQQQQTQAAEAEALALAEKRAAEKLAADKARLAEEKRLADEAELQRVREEYAKKGIIIPRGIQL